MFMCVLMVEDTNCSAEYGVDLKNCKIKYLLKYKYRWADLNLKVQHIVSVCVCITIIAYTTRINTVLQSEYLFHWLDSN